MMRHTRKVNIFFKILILVIMFTGIVVRIAVYLQNRNLFIDEANIARNIYESNFLQLLGPLKYEQYAPPLFMWILKMFSAIFGYSEYAFRILPLLSSIGAIIFLNLLLKEFTSIKSLWYPLGLFVVGYMSIRYATELKQYIFDVFIILLLIFSALKININTIKTGKFILLWIIIGSLAIWASMPTVFVLSGIGLYYLYQLIFDQKKYNKIWVVFLIGTIWLVQFGLYYFIILRPQIESSYLQNFHHDYFLFATPTSKEEWLHNWYVIKNLIQETGGFWGYAVDFNVLLMILGAIMFLKRNTAKSLLIIIPLVAVIIAAALNQYSLIPRVALFVSPLMLVLIGYGFESLIKLKPIVLKLFLFGFGMYCIWSLSMLKLAWQPFETEQITDAMNFVLQSPEIKNGKQLYIHNGARPAFIYYTQIHPEKDHWEKIKNAHLLNWDASFGEIAQKQNADSFEAFIFTSVAPEELIDKKTVIEKYKKEIAKIDKPGCHVFIYKNKIE